MKRMLCLSIADEEWEELVLKICFSFVTVALCISLCFAQSKPGQDITPDKIIAEHLKSVGNAGVLAATNKTFLGAASVNFYQGGTGSQTGTAMFVSDGHKLSIVMKFSDINYPGEYFAFDGKDVSVGYMSPGQKSPIADFLFRHSGIIKDGLMGGILSEAWPLLNIQERQVDLKSKETTIEGRRLYEMDYAPKQSLRDTKIRLYFDPENFHHVRTEYRVRIKDDMSTDSAQSLGSGGFTGNADLHESIYNLVEKFDDFKKVGVMFLPHSYEIDYSVEGQANAFVGKWTLKAQQWAFNKSYDEKIFKALK
jgi:hypothetical protein